MVHSLVVTTAQAGERYDLRVCLVKCSFSLYGESVGINLWLTFGILRCLLHVAL